MPKRSPRQGICTSRREKGKVMKTSIGLLELRSIPPGIETADAVLKSASVELLLATPICPGKYVIIFSGAVGAVDRAMETGEKTAGSWLVCRHTVHNVNAAVPAALLGTVDPGEIRSLGVLETISALGAVRAGDICAKAAAVRLLEIRIARGLGGKGYLILTGEVASVQAAITACTEELSETGEIISTSVIASPHPGVGATIF